jgi:ribose 5-phosphate isomerase B
MIIIGADHAGFDLKNIIINYLKKNNIGYIDVTDYDKNPDDDYTDVAIKVCKNVLEDESNLGIAICGTGIGICVACNKIKGIIATPCYNEYTAKMVRQDNNSNVLCLGGRLEYASHEEDVIKIVETYINTEFAGERHLRRVNKIKDIESKFGEKLWE